ncbi:MAG: hypothetical protein J5626_04315 [Lachnospiraceae bacterium]|nr:hypothetical protein [Lachnospiraceae bacterium]
MSKTKTISEQIKDLERQNERLSVYEKCFDIMLKSEFNFDRKSIHNLLEKSTKSTQ